VRGKGNKERLVLMLPAVREAVSAWLAVHPQAADPGVPLVLGQKDGPLNLGVAERTVRNLGLGLSEHLTPYALRHSFITHLLGGGVDLRSIQEMRCFVSLGATTRYTAVDKAADGNVASDTPKGGCGPRGRRLQRTAGRLGRIGAFSRHGRACPGHPPSAVEAQMAGTRPAMTGKGANASQPACGSL
jgi:Phage integrase family